MTTSGRVYCWAWNQYGLGIGNDKINSRPTPVSGGLTFRSLDVGHSHTCGVAVDGTGYCWGHNASAALGDGTQTDRLVPTAIVGWRVSAGPAAGGGG